MSSYKSGIVNFYFKSLNLGLIVDINSGKTHSFTNDSFAQPTFSDDLECVVARKCKLNYAEIKAGLQVMFKESKGDYLTGVMVQSDFSLVKLARQAVVANIKSIYCEKPDFLAVPNKFHCGQHNEYFVFIMLFICDDQFCYEI